LVISVDFAAGAGLAGVGAFISSAAKADPIIRPPTAVVTMSVLSM
jgi:hypothetical protein